MTNPKVKKILERMQRATTTTVLCGSWAFSFGPGMSFAFMFPCNGLEKQSKRHTLGYCFLHLQVAFCILFLRMFFFYIFWINYSGSQNRRYIPECNFTFPDWLFWKPKKGYRKQQPAFFDYSWLYKALSHGPKKSVEPVHPLILSFLFLPLFFVYM